MGVTIAQTVHAEQVSELGGGSGKNQGTLKAEGKEYSVFMFADSEAVSESASEFLQDMNHQKCDLQILHEFQFLHLTQQMIETEQQIAELLGELSHPEESHSLQQQGLQPNQGHFQSERAPSTLSLEKKESENAKNSQPSSHANGKNSEVYTSLFSLARSFNTTQFQKRQGEKNHETATFSEKGQTKENRPILFNLLQPSEGKAPQESHYEREGQGEKQGRQNQEEEEGKQQNQQQQSHSEQKSKKITSLGAIHAARSTPSSNANKPQVPRVQAAQNTSSNMSPKQTMGSVESIYIRFMALMARILGQAEYEAHQLYLRIKERTDNIDVLTLLVSKINSEKGAIDWSNNEEMKKLIDKVRAIGVDIPQGKYSWTEDEKRLLKENIQMRKDSMEKMTQLERTDMQRFLQEASQCHQARSNVLKLLKEVIDTIIANMRGG